ncbi:MAG: serine hydrolase, partial [Sedimentisphaerales bacterium]|nr:serine hydrolase [Sedimentisphaerales bacterium]
MIADTHLRNCVSLVRWALILALTAGAAAVRAQTLTAAEPESVGLSSDRLERITSLLNEYVEQERLPGGVLLVARRGRIAYFEAFGERDREAHAPMTKDTIFRIASQTKA